MSSSISPRPCSSPILSSSTEESARGNHLDVLARKAKLLAQHAGRRIEHLARAHARPLVRIAHALLQRLLDASMLLDERARRLCGELVARRVRLFHDPAQILEGDALELDGKQAGLVVHELRLLVRHLVRLEREAVDVELALEPVAARPHLGALLVVAQRPAGSS